MTGNKTIIALAALLTYCGPAAVRADITLGIAVPDNELTGSSMPAELDDYAALGAKWIRTDFRWSVIQPQQGTPLQWARNDAIVDSAVARGFSVLALLHSIPAWVNDNGGLADSSNRAAFAAFSRAVAARYKDRISHWEVWNEPNLKGFWGGQAPDPVSFCDLMVRGASAIHKEDPTAFIVSAGLSPVPDPAPGDPRYGVDYLSARAFVEAIYATGADTAFDAFGYHPYAWPLMPDNTDSWNGWYMMESMVRNTMIAGGDSTKPIWLTEFGAPTKGSNTSLSEDSQIQQLLTACTRMENLAWAGPLFWYSYRDRGGDENDTENWFGLIRPDGTAKPAYAVFSDLNTVEPDTARGLVAHWPLDGDAADASGNGHDGTVTGAEPVSALFGGGYRFNDATAMIRVPHHADLSYGSGGSYSISLWANPARLRDSWTAVLSKSRDATPWYGVYINAGNNWDFRGPVPGAEGSTAAAGTWIHLTGVQDGLNGTRTIYINGTVTGTGMAAPADGTGDLVIGNVLGQTGEAFEGMVDEVRMYDRALLAAEITTLATPPVSGLRTPAPSTVTMPRGTDGSTLYNLHGEQMPGIHGLPAGIYLRAENGILIKHVIHSE